MKSPSNLLIPLIILLTLYFVAISVRGESTDPSTWPRADPRDSLRLMAIKIDAEKWCVLERLRGRDSCFLSNEAGVTWSTYIVCRDHLSMDGSEPHDTGQIAIIDSDARGQVTIFSPADSRCPADTPSYIGANGT